MWVRRSEYEKLLERIGRMEGEIEKLEVATTIATPTGYEEESWFCGTRTITKETENETVAAVLVRLLNHLGIKQKYEKGTAATVKMCAEGYKETTEEGE